MDPSGALPNYPWREALHAVNTVFAHSPSHTPDVAVARSNAFYPRTSDVTETYALGECLEAIRGYHLSARLVPGRILLNVQASSAAFVSPMNVRNCVEVLGRNERNNDSILRKARSLLKGLRVRTNYIPDNKGDGNTKQPNKTIIKDYTVSSIRGSSAEQKFSWDNHGMVTVQDYFRRQYEIRLSYPKAPLVVYVSGGQERYIPSELCEILPGQLARKKLSGPQTAKMVKFAVRPPNINAAAIAGRGMDLIAGQRSLPLLKDFDFNVSSRMLVVPARQLQPPTPSYGGRAQKRQLFPGSWNLSQEKFYKPAALPKWSVLIVQAGYRSGPSGAAREIGHWVLDTARREFATYGIQTGPKADQIFVAEGLPSGADALPFLDSYFKKASDEKFHMLFVVIPEKDTTVYGMIKFLGDVKYGIMTVVAQMTNISKCQKLGDNFTSQFFANVALKFNLKAGGVNHTVPTSELNVNTKPNEPVFDQNTMLVGIDCTHPAPGSRKNAPSVAAVVASIDTDLAQFPGNVRSQAPREEMVQELKEIMIERLKYWGTRHGGRLPDKVIVYRDGVSESDYQRVLDFEYGAMKKAFQDLYKPPKKHPRICIIVATKRHHIRFYPTDDKRKARGNNNNTSPGTVVDRHCTGEGRHLWDFWLQAHLAMQGTAKYCHYVVLKNNIFPNADSLEQFTHKLCYLYGRATRSVSYAPPAYYADHLAGRASRGYLREAMEDTSATESEFSFQTNDPDTWNGRDFHRNLANRMLYI
ncbi:Piwi domain-containing protein [Lineolata rhizophorae]|uniref:Piwi domain-containing protein n=1 Tax=Lineolata rhizophorae TaxID=578093 RepID=A0A6A6P9B3_9PEZI|nr:Piwi domain-containing protein [Lineolata rhizophorae]